MRSKAEDDTIRSESAVGGLGQSPLDDATLFKLGLAFSGLILLAVGGRGANDVGGCGTNDIGGRGDLGRRVAIGVGGRGARSGFF